MEKFNVLPTDERFQNLSNEQIGFILESMILDRKEEERAMKGLNSKNHYEDDDDSFWNVPMDDFVALKEEHDESDIAEQLNELVGKESMQKAKERFKSTEEYNQFLESGGKLAKQMQVDSYIEDRLQAVYEEVDEIQRAKANGEVIPKREGQINLKPTEVDTIKEAIELFDGDDDDDDFYI